MFLLRFHKALCLLRFYFSRVFANFYFKGIIGDLLTTFDFSVSIYDSNLFCIAFFVLFSMATFVEYFWVRKFSLPFEDAIVIRWLGSGDDAVGNKCPQVSGFARVPSSGFLDHVPSWL